ncbi:MAG: cation diffusion facilitator family transporter [Bacteroidota bacterium]|nr:cation diffusion facilitator family transporter [Bacteroidota bacterium]
MSGSHNHIHSGHSHSHLPEHPDSYNKAFIIGICLNIVFIIAEIITGLIYNSIALLTDAGHNISDVAGLFLALLAFRFAKKKATQTFTYGYKKTTVLAAFINAVILLIAIGILGYESIGRLSNPEIVQGDKIAWVAALGIIVNSVSAYLFFKNQKKDINIRSAYLHLLADALVSFGVVVSGIVIVYTKWYWLDPVIGLVIMLVILASTWALLRDSFKMAVDAVPSGIDVEHIRDTILKMADVTDMDHIHVWPLSTTENALTAHVQINEKLNFEEKIKLVQKIKHELEHLNIHHSTIEMDGVKKSGNC